MHFQHLWHPVDAMKGVNEPICHKSEIMLINMEEASHVARAGYFSWSVFIEHMGRMRGTREKERRAFVTGAGYFFGQFYL